MKYDKIEKENMNGMQNNKIEDMLMDGETVLWQDKPVKSAFILNNVITMFPFVIIWLFFDVFAISTIFITGVGSKMLMFIIPFFLLHLLPVWIWIGRIATSFRRWKNTDYILTDKRILLRSGFIGVDYKNIYYKDIKDVNLKVGVFDRMLNVGDIHIQCNDFIGGVASDIYDIKNPYETLKLIQKIVLDIQTDMIYPNDLRPSENHGYNTKYKN